MDTRNTAGSAGALGVTLPASRPMGGTQRRTVWQEEKRQRTLSLTDTAWVLATTLGETQGLNRSEVFEILLRYAQQKHLDLSSLRGQLTAPQVPPTPAAV